MYAHFEHQQISGFSVSVRFGKNGTRLIFRLFRCVYNTGKDGKTRKSDRKEIWLGRMGGEVHV
jgi:hypothetical protein